MKFCRMPTIILILVLLFPRSSAFAQSRAKPTAFKSAHFWQGVWAAHIVLFTGSQIEKSADSTHSHFNHPPALDRFFRDRFLNPHKSSNWLDQNGVFYVLGAGSVLATAAPALSYHRIHVETLLYDFLAYESGAAFTGGVTRLIKGIASRPRPYVYYKNPLFKDRLQNSDPENYRSFVSGHSSLAFYTAAFLHYRFAQIFDDLSHPPSQGWCIAADVALFGGAAYVAYSRLQIDQHYFTDVLGGALVGYASGWLAVRWFYRWQKATQAQGKRSLQIQPLMLGVMVRF